MRKAAALLSLLGHVSAAAPERPMLWPLPQQVASGSDTVVIAADAFDFQPASSPSQELQDAFGRYKAQYFKRRAPAPPAAAVAAATVAVDNDAADLQLGVDESYTLKVSADGIAITAKTQFGAYHAMETLSQLIIFNATAKAYVVNNAPWSVTDAPRFVHREVLIDTSRHYQPVASLKHIIQSFTYAKVNTMHWHIVDAQSFPWIAPSAPKIALGAYSEQEKYTIEDIQDVIEFARARGVRVVMEIDTPGHAASWCSGFPDVCPSATCTMPLRPDTNATFELIEKLIGDLAKVAPDAYFHIGGDEVNTDCWSQNADTVKWMDANNYTAHDGYLYFVQRVTQIVQKLGKHVVGWDELWENFGTQLDKKTIIHQWRANHLAVKPAVQAGYQVIWSNDGPWYLDHEDQTWQSMYEANPCDGLTDKECSTFVLGGGGEMWAERIDESDLQNTIWPRMGAIAERLWSSADQTQVAADAEKRYAYFRCYLNHQGVGAAPYNNPLARTNPPVPGSCYLQ
eukprot:TRINITY_DN3551_c0_g1_i1.p2 TRINITY_DN3551_c0_g1~~TRINITY_DN3551_c0_g1_i1.p2  ORF type:complete len:512 (+),score=167.02 TRINITY_DN3551_c0_g1_i1:70-1605(+)